MEIRTAVYPPHGFRMLEWFYLRDFGWIWNFDVHRLQNQSWIIFHQEMNEDRDFNQTLLVQFQFWVSVNERRSLQCSATFHSKLIRWSLSVSWCIQDVDYVYIQFSDIKSLIKCMILQPRFDFSCIWNPANSIHFFFFTFSTIPVNAILLLAGYLTPTLLWGFISII